MNGLDLFSGIGGISLALSPWVRTIAYCENDDYAQGVLLSRMADGQLDVGPIWDDVRTLSGGMLPRVEIITGGFPCQDISVAGTGAGLGGRRSGLFFEIVRLTRDLRPRFVFLENVPAIAVRGLDRVLLEFTSLGYDCRWTIVSAAEMGAPHLRERWFLLAHANGVERGGEYGRRRTSDRDWDVPAVTRDDGEAGDVSDSPGVGRRQIWQGHGNVGRSCPREVAYPTCERTRGLPARSWSEGKGEADAHRKSEGLANTDGPRLERWLDSVAAWNEFPIGGGGGSWPSGVPQPSLRRGDDGLSNRVDRLRGLGNAVVPLQAREAFRRLAGVA